MVQKTAGCSVSPQSSRRLCSKMDQIPDDFQSPEAQVFGDNVSGNGKSCLTNLVDLYERKEVDWYPP